MQKTFYSSSHYIISIVLNNNKTMLYIQLLTILSKYSLIEFIFKCKSMFRKHVCFKSISNVTLDSIIRVRSSYVRKWFSACIISGWENPNAGNLGLTHYGKFRQFSVDTKSTLKRQIYVPHKLCNELKVDIKWANKRLHCKHFYSFRAESGLFGIVVDLLAAFVGILTMQTK